MSDTKMTDTKKLEILMAAVASHLINPGINDPRTANVRLGHLWDAFESIGGRVPDNPRYGSKSRLG